MVSLKSSLHWQTVPFSSLKQCAIRHQQFDYPVRDIEGRVRVNGTEVRFEQLRGRNGNCEVRGEGTFRPADGLHLQLIADRVPLNQELRLALQPSTRNVWDSLRPTGDLDQVRLDLRQGTGATRPDIAVDFDIHRADNPHQPDAAIAQDVGLGREARGGDQKRLLFRSPAASRARSWRRLRRGPHGRQRGSRPLDILVECRGHLRPRREARTGATVTRS